MRKLLLILFAFLLAGFALQQPAQAQFIGFTSPQTTQEQVFTGVGVGDFTTNVANRGQNTHIFNYRVVSGTITAITATIEATQDGTNFFTISDTAHALAAGITTASGYYPLVRCRIVITGTSPVVDGFYSGTSIALERPRGLSDASALNISIITLTGDASIAGTFTFNPPKSNIAGQLIFRYTTLGTPGSGCGLEINANSEVGLFALPPNEQVLSVQQSAGANRLNTLYLPALAADRVDLNYSCFDSFPSSGNYEIFHIPGDTTPPTGHFVRIVGLTAVGTTAGVAVGQPIQDQVGVEVGFSVIRAPQYHTVQLVVAGVPSVCTFQLEGSLNSTGGSSGSWFDLSGSQDCTSDIMFHVIDRPVLWIRGNLTALTGGIDLSVIYLGVQ